MRARSAQPLIVRRLSTPGALICLVASSALASAPATAQQNNRNTMITSDGQTQHVVHYARPDISAILRPEYGLTDVDLLARELVLREDQRELASLFLREYLDAFESLKHAHYQDLLEEAEPQRDAPPADPLREADHPGDAGGVRPGGGGGAPPAPPRLDSESRDAIRDIMLEELRNEGFEIDSMDDFPYQPNVSIGVSLVQADDGSPPAPAFNVNVSFGSDDDSLAGDVRDKLQAAADRMVPRISEHAKKEFEDRIAGQLRSPIADGANPLEEAWSENERLRSRVNDLSAERERLRSELEERLRTLLDEQQLERWPGFLRAFTRIKTLPWGVLDEEQTDLVAVIESLQLEPVPPAVAAALGEYETRLHTLLTLRNDLLETADADIDHALYEGETRRAVSTAKRLTGARVAVCDLNSEFTHRFSEELPGEHAQAFRARALETSFPRVYRQTLGSQAFDLVSNRDDLAADKRETIDGLRASYHTDLGLINERLRTLIRRTQADRLVSEIERVAAMIDGGDDRAGQPRDDSNAQVAEEFERRVELDRLYMGLLYAQLTEAERKGLPRIPGDDALDPVRAEHHEGGGG